VGQPESTLTAATSIITNNNNCVGCNNGAIDITVNGGTKPYQFLWSNGATSEDIDKLASGNYSVIISDNKGCSIEYNYVINESGIEITKDGVYVDSNNDGITNVGDVVAYSFIVKNTGNVTLTNVTVLDNNATIVGGPIASLAVGATDTTTFTATHQLTQNDIDKGIVYNIALVRGYDPEEKSVTDTSIDSTPCIKCPRSLECPDCTITELNQNPSIDITKDGVYVDSN
ncbi:DUF7507 domain-containing protein, partial [Flavobacterium sp. RSSB_23]|uniref:DUF7507 domain-containing protein n=1 Tax=Flavobacterium sp. RSSB_23 TaxID=3447668 RepID=UPI003F2CCC81